MRRTLPFFLWLLIVLVTFGEARAADVLLNPQTNLRVVEQGDFGNARGQLRDLLEKYLLLTLGKTDLGGSGETVSFVVEAQAPTWREIAEEELEEVAGADAFEVAILPRPVSSVRIRGTTVLAAGFGVMHFLEKYLDVFWAFPGPLGLCLPETREFRLPATTERRSPALLSRSATGFVFRDDSLPRNRRAYSGLLQEHRGFFYGHDYFKSLRLHPLASPSHNMIRVISPDLKQGHPEVFPVRDGKRRFSPGRDRSARRAGGAWQAWHPCYTNPTTLEIAVAKAKEAFSQGKCCFSLGINDGRCVQCECPECRRVGFPRSYYNFVRAVAERLKDDHPPRLVGLIAYGDVKDPPEDLLLPENVLVMVVGGGPEAAVRWAKHARLVGTYEHFPGQGFWIPNLPLEAMRSNARFCQERGIRFYRGEWHPLWAYDAPRIYLHSRLLWDPHFDLHAGLRRFCDAAFGQGGEPMYRFYRRWAELRDEDVVPNGLTPMLGRRPNRLWRDPVRQFAECSPDDFHFGSECIAKAQAAVKTGPAEARLEMVAAFFEDSRTLYRICSLANEMFDADAPDNARDRMEEALQLRAKRCAVLENMKDHPEWFVGTSARVDDGLVPSWEERSSVDWMRMLENAVFTELVRLNESGEAAPALPEQFRRFGQPSRSQPATVHRRRSHPWYADSRRYVPLKSFSTTSRGLPQFSRSENGTVPFRKREVVFGQVPNVTTGRSTVHFQTAAGTGERSEHPSWLGARKHHWMAALVRSVPIDDRNLYLIDLDATGRRGRLVLSVTTRTTRTTRREAMLLEDFRGPQRRIRKRLAVGPSVFDRRPPTEAPVPSAGERRTIHLHLTWEPFDDQAPLEGSCSLTRIEWDGAE